MSASVSASVWLACSDFVGVSAERVYVDGWEEIMLKGVLGSFLSADMEDALLLSSTRCRGRRPLLPLRKRLVRMGRELELTRQTSWGKSPRTGYPSSRQASEGPSP